MKTPPWNIVILIMFAAFLAVYLFTPSTKVIVNMPADAKPLATLVQPGDKVIGNDRAVLWWTVFKTTLEMRHDSSLAYYAANEAVDKVYGPIPAK